MGQRVPISALPRSRKKKASRKAVYVGKNLSVDTNQGTLLIFQRWGSGSGNNRNLFCPSTLAHRSLLFFCPRGTSRVDYLSTTSTTLLLFLFFSLFFLLFHPVPPSYLLLSFSSHRYNVRATSRIMHNGEKPSVSSAILTPFIKNLSSRSSLFIFLNICIIVMHYMRYIKKQR